MQDVAIPQVRPNSSGPFTLGTAQLGLPNYGRANTTGRPERGAAIALVREAVERGIDCIDTARGYQFAEAVVGEALKPFGDRVEVVTKLDPLEELPANAPPAQVRQAVDASVFRSCRELGRAALPMLLLHRWQ